MNRNNKIPGKLLLLLVLPLAVALATGARALAQAGDEPPTIEISPADIRPADVLDYRYHITRARTEAATSARLNGSRSGSLEAEIRARAAAVPRPGFYPADLSYQGGNVIQSTQFHNIYLGCADGTCWGNPVGFENDLSVSKFIHLVDPYVNAHAKNRYTVGTAFNTASVDPPCSSPTNCTYDDIQNIVASIAQTSGAGYGHIYHVFLPQGVDTCTPDGACYSPDNLSTFYFCGYHSSLILGSGATVYYTVEPYQNVLGCQVASSSPNGQEADSTDSTLSHETFETITDPDPGYGWVAVSSLTEYGSEIGDICDTITSPPPFVVNKTRYEIQLEYSAKYHACSAVP